MKPHPFLKRNVNRFIEVARKRSGNETLFSNYDSIKWPPEEEPARYIYPMDYKTRSDPAIDGKPKVRLNYFKIIINVINIIEEEGVCV